MKHIIVMSLSGAVGLTALFVVDLIDLFFLSLLGEKNLAAAVGFAGSIIFITTSLGIGLSIAAGAFVSRAFGEKDLIKASRYMVNVCFLTLMVSAFIAALIWIFIPELLTFLGASGQVHSLAERYLNVLVPSMPVLCLSMCMSAGLRAKGDAQLSMSSSLAGGVVNAILDPVFIFLMGLYIEGAALASVLARLTILGVSSYGVIIKHSLLGKFQLCQFQADLPSVLTIAVPAVVTNLATPVSSAWIINYLSRFGDGYVAGYAIIGRVTPVVFGIVFALSGAIGPIVGQNYGAKLIPRIRQSFIDALLFTTAYVLVVSAGLFMVEDTLVSVFKAKGQAAELVLFFCTWTASSFVFSGSIFVTNACFNNLGRPFYSTVLNWGKATVGTMPFVWLAASWMGATGVLLGQALGSVVFAVIAVWLAFVRIKKVGDRVRYEQAMDKLTHPADTLQPCAINPMSSDCAVLAQMVKGAECEKELQKELEEEREEKL